MGRRARRACVACLGAVATVLLAASCKEATSIEIEVSTTAQPSELRGTSFYVGAPGATEVGPVVAATTEVRADGFIGTLVAVPETGDGARVSIKIVAGVGRSPDECTANNGYRGCIVARRTLAYQPHVRLRLPIVLEPACLGIPCSESSTCHRGSCVDARIPFCDESTPCSLPDVPGGPVPPFDASAPDVVEDGGVVTVDGATTSDGAVASDSSTDAPSEGGTTGRSIKCLPNAPCTGTANCCVHAGGSGMCSPGGAACTMPTFTVACDGAEDCPMGTQCCVGTTSSYCVVQCPPGTEACKTSGDCHRAGEACTNTFASVYGRCQ